MKNNYYDLNYTVIKNRDEKEKLNYEYKDNDYNNINFFVTPNHYIERKKIIKY